MTLFGGMLTPDGPGSPANPTRHDPRAEHGPTSRHLRVPLQRAGLADGQAFRHLDGLGQDRIMLYGALITVRETATG